MQSSALLLSCYLRDIALKQTLVGLQQVLRETKPIALLIFNTLMLIHKMYQPQYTKNDFWNEAWRTK